MPASGISICRRAEEAFVNAKEYLQRGYSRYLILVGSMSRDIDVGDDGRGVLNSRAVRLE